ncbi:hypothetical protein NP233_g5868 [Leucocoprinus birnbaumii]|uniref:Uncharacterized protein n=1 Tax=Leucocoprinus birnbaumii TaxID=56174 RepID=A0AAD5VS14_9AGAR|nr:hypothetical protein NP233_g5868 [Leucocoprinus birnbaumii]
METLNLNTLANSLPTAQQKAEQELLNNFKSAALSITTLYRSSRQNAKRAYNAGYAAACQDLLTMIQQGVSVGGLGPSASSSSHGADNDGMTIGRVMDWTEARLEAIKAQEEEEDEEEEREREKERARSTSAAPTSSKSSMPAQTAPSNNSLPLTSLPTPSSPILPTTNHPPEPTTPSPPLAPSNAQRPAQRSKTRSSLKGEPSASYTHFPTIPSASVFNFVPETVTPVNTPSPFPELPAVPAVGSKRRHAMMMMLDATAASSTNASVPATQTPVIGSAPAATSNLYNPSRRRTKSTRGQQQQQNQNINIQPSAEAMDVEDDGRERKRVARR